MVDTLFLLYRKFLKSSEIVYNELEKNDMTKERRGLRHDVVIEVFCFGLEVTALSDYRERIIMSMDLSVSHNLSILFK